MPLSDPHRSALSLAEVAQLLRVHESDLCAIFNRGELHSLVRDETLGIDPDDVVSMLETRVLSGALDESVFVEFAAMIARRLE